MAQQTPALKLFDLLISRDFDPEMLDSAGKAAPDPAEAEVFSFDFRAESGKDYGTVVIMLGDDNDLEVYCADNVGKTMEGSDKTDWFRFLEQLKNFAVRNFMSFSTKNLNRLRYSMQGQAAIKEGLFESWTGKKDVSYNAGPNESRLMIKHKRSLGEGEARFRYVESLFIETADGERYKLPFKNLTAGKAMLEHVRNGGRPYDMRGAHIVEMISELNVLSRFRRANHGKLLEGDTATLVEQTNTYYENLQRNLKSLTHRRGYDAYFESWTPAEITEEEMVIEGLKHLFVTQSIDQRIEDALPLIAKIQQQENAMKEANIFEAWANSLTEGTWQLPDTPEKQAKLLELLSTDLPVGADATNATEQLYDLLGDDELFDQLEELAERDANADARQVIYDRMQMLSDDPDVRKVMDQLQVDATAEMNPAEATPADLEEESLEDETTIGGDASDAFIRDVSIKQDNEVNETDDLAGILKTAGVPAKPRPAPDYELEEAGEGSTAQVIKKLLDPIAQGLAGNGGKSLLITPISEEDPNKDKKDSGSILPAVAAGAAGAGLGYMAGKAMNKGTSTPKPAPLPSATAGSDKYGSWEAPGQASPPTATGTDLGISAPAAGSALDTAMSGMLENDLEEGPDTFSPGRDTKASYALQKGLETVPFAGAGAVAGAGIGGALGSLVGQPGAGMAAGAALGGYAGKKVADNAIYADDGKTPTNWKPTVEAEEETNEGWKGQLAGGTVGSLAGGAAGSTLGPIGAAVGSAAGGTAGQMIGDKLGGKEEEESPLKGKYGHSGKMKAVAENPDFLTRLKELSGMIRN